MELSQDYVISMSRLLTDVTAGDSIFCRRFLYTALAIQNPMETGLDKAVDDCRKWAIDNDTKFQGMSEKDILDNSADVAISSIERYYELNPDKLKYIVDYNSFVTTWVDANVNTKNSHKSIVAAAIAATKMSYGRISTLTKNNKTIKVTKSMTVFRSIEVIGLDKIVIKLNPDFMPYVVLLNRAFVNSGYTSFPIRYLTGKRTISEFIMTGFALRFFKAGGNIEQKFSFDIVTLRRILGCEKKYPAYKDFKTHIIDKGIKGVNKDQKGGISICVINEIKRGRSVVKIEFQITSKGLSEKKKTRLLGAKNTFCIKNKNNTEFIESEPAKEAAIKAIKKMALGI